MARSSGKGRRAAKQELRAARRDLKAAGALGPPEGSTLPALVLRAAIGPTMFVHGYNKVFGGGGLQGTERWFDGLGFSPAKVHARMAATTEMTSGVLITLGALNPLPQAMVIGVMVVASQSDHRNKGFFMFKNGWEYVAFLGTATAALAALGNGKLSVDHLIGNRRRGIKAMLVAGTLGVANGMLLLEATFDPEGKEKEKQEAAASEEAAGSTGDLPEDSAAAPRGTSSNGSGQSEPASTGD